MENSKKLFVRAFMEAERINASKFKAEGEIEWEFSKSFERTMNKLIKKNNHIRLSTRRNIRRGLLVAIIAIIAMFTGIMSVSATRTPFIEFIKKTFPQYNEIALSEESTPPVDTIETEYTLTDLPEGFEIDTYQKDEYSVFVIWKNENYEEIIFFQEISDLNLSVDNDHNYKEIYINGYEAYLNEYTYNSSLKWTDGNYWFTVRVPKSIDNDIDIIELAKNISKKK
ncbi:MAG: DUF4367 domain-containing protein [Eubacterium sp.]